MNVKTGQLRENEERQVKICLIAGIAIWFVELNVIYALRRSPANGGGSPSRSVRFRACSSFR